MSGPILQLRDIAFAWPDQAPVLEAVNLEVEPGERVFLHGPSGSGKSTLLALIGGLMRPATGTIHCAGQNLSALGRGARDRFRADHLGVIFQQFNLLPYLDARANVELACRFSARRRRRAGDPAAAAGELLAGMDLEPALWARRADALSTGQQQRVAAARALIGYPDLVLADEPTSSLDADRRQAFLELLFTHLEHCGAALLFVSHDESLSSRFDRRLALADMNHAGEPA